MLTPQQIRRSITPLRMVFWGGLLCIFDLTLSHTMNGSGWSFDVLNDAVGMLLITLAVRRLEEFEVHPRYALLLRLALIVSVLSLIRAICGHIIMPLPDLWRLMLHLFSIVCLLAIIGFCVAMRWLCEAASLELSARSWRLTTILFVAVYLIPLGAIHLLSVAVYAVGTQFHVDLGPLGLLLLVVFAIPIVHLFISTSRMRNAAARLPAQADAARTQPL